MNRERQVTVRGAPVAIATWLEMLDGPITLGWSRAADIEKKARGKRSSRWPICLVWSGSGVHPRTAVFLQPISDAEVGVMSLVALDRGELAPEDISAVLKAFQTALIAPRGDELQLTDRLSSAGLSELISPQAQARFRAFAHTANKAVPHSGLDLPRWYTFSSSSIATGPPRRARPLKRL